MLATLTAHVRGTVRSINPSESRFLAEMTAIIGGVSLFYTSIFLAGILIPRDDPMRYIMAAHMSVFVVLSLALLVGGIIWRTQIDNRL